MSEINREEQKRVLTVTADIADGYNIGLVSQDLEKRLKEYQVPEGYSVTMEGENETINDAIYRLVLMGLLGIVLIYCIMVAFSSSLSVLHLSLCLPFRWPLQEDSLLCS